MSCPTCGGLGWVYITEAAQQRLAPEPEVPDDPFEAARLRREYRDKRAKARNTVYPCRDCNQKRFYTWSGGHWDPDHDTAACNVCADRLPPKRRRHQRQEVDPSPATALARDYTEGGTREDF